MAVKTRNIALTPEQAELADKEARRLGISFSAFIRLLMSQYFEEVRFERRREENQNEVAGSKGKEVL